MGVGWGGAEQVAGEPAWWGQAGPGHTGKHRRVFSVESLEGLQRGGVLRRGPQSLLEPPSVSPHAPETPLLGSLPMEWGIREATAREVGTGQGSERQLSVQGRGSGHLPGPCVKPCPRTGQAGPSSREASPTCSGPTTLVSETLAAI